MSKLKIAAFSLVLALGAAAAPASAARLAASADSGGCSACGPAPCCIVFGIVWCGCPFADNAKAADSAQGQAIANKCSAKPAKGKVLTNDEVNAFVAALKTYGDKGASCENPKAVKALKTVKGAPPAAGAR